jgi:ribosomal protein S18 acetylase RimI-like enzyme
MEFRSELLGREHRREPFACGVPALDNYFRKYAGQDVKRHAAAVFVMTPPDRPGCVAGYYTLSAFSLKLAELPESARKMLPRYPDASAILIGRLARDRHFPGLGSRLLADALTRCFHQAEEIGAALVVVDAQNDNARSFYEKHGFLRLEASPKRLFLPMKTVASLS